MRIGQRSRQVAAIGTLSLVSALAASASHGQIATDGTLDTGGPRTLSPTGGIFQIGPQLGQSVGTNLFHSFSQFNIQSGQTAQFTGPANTLNVISRVTGGSASTINGTLQTVGMPQANFFLINPAGVVMGVDATLDVAGSFIVTTADELQLADGGRFSAATPSASVLTTAPPSAFGFLKPQPAAITVTGGQRLSDFSLTRLQVAEGKSISIIGGPITVTDQRVLAPRGRVNLVAVGAPGQVTLDASDPAAVVNVTNAPALADVTVRTFSLIGAIGDEPGEIDQPGGSVVVRGRDMTLSLSDIKSFQIDGPGAPGGGIDIDVTGRLTIDRGSLDARTTSSFDGGAVTVRAGSIRMDGGGQPGSNGILSETTAQISGGRGGNVTLTTGLLQLANNAQVITTSGGTGRAGDVHITADEIEIDDNNRRAGSLVTGGALAAFTGIGAQTTGLPGGDAGNITIQTGRLELAEGGLISATTFGSGNAGVIDIRATESVELLGPLSSIVADTALRNGGAAATGQGGQIKIDVGTGLLLIRDRAFIATTTRGPGIGGSIQIRAGDVLIDGAGQLAFTGISAGTESTAGDAGLGGSVLLNGSNVELRDGAGVAALTRGPAKAGDLEINAAGSLLIDGRGGGGATGLTVETRPDIEADGGTIRVRTGRSISLFAGQISASASRDGGNIELTAPLLVSLNASSIVGAATLNGGNITIDPVLIDLSNASFISANAINGAGGNINLITQILRQSANSSITASSQFGVQGTVDIDTTLDAGQLLGTLNVNLLSGNLNLLDVCAGMAADQSTFQVMGRGGVAIDLDGWLPAFNLGIEKE